MTVLNVQSPSGDLARTVELPAEIFDVTVNVPLIHQVVVAQLAAARTGSHDTKTRGEVSGGGRKPYRQKGTGRARQGSTRAPQFAGGGTVHGPTPRGYAQRTPKKMKAAALRGALSDRARDGRLHVVTGLVDGEAPSTKEAVANLARMTSRRHVLLVAERHDLVTWKSLRNAAHVHLIAPDQLNPYDVLVSDDVVFTEGAYAAFVASPQASPQRRASLADAVATLAPATETTTATRRPATAPTTPPPSAATPVEDSAAMSEQPATQQGSTEPAGAGATDAEMAREVAAQTSGDRAAQTAFERAGAEDTETAAEESATLAAEMPEEPGA